MAENIENIIESLLYIVPILHKRLLKVDPQEVEADAGLPRAQLGILLALREEINLPISDIAQRLLIPKPQMTRLISAMVESGLVARQPSRYDRRVVQISMTDQGKSILDKNESALKRSVRKHLVAFTAPELEELAAILTRLKDLSSRLDGKS
jgi:DNA-binding MarR family transcriptional regulator